MITITVTNYGDPIVDGFGRPLAGVPVSFILVDSKGKAADGWDVTSGERIAPGPIQVLTNDTGVFSVGLWPTSRGDRLLYWKCSVVGIDGIQSFKASLTEATNPISWVMFRFGGSAPTPQQVALWAQVTGGVATKAVLDSVLGAYGDGTCLIVTNDPTPGNNGTWRRESGAWVQASFDRVGIVEGRVSTLESNPQLATLGAESGYVWALTDKNGRACLAVALDGTVVITKPNLPAGIVTPALLSSAVSGLIAVALDSKETGYAWALVDSAGRSALMVANDGTVSIPKINVAGQIGTASLTPSLAALIPVTLPAETGYSWALVDSVGRMALGVKTDGTVVGKFSLTNVAGGGYLTPTKNLYFIGDSLTNGAGGQTTWREQLPALISSGRVSTNNAVGGDTSTQQAARCGAYVSLLTLSGNQIPASGGVAVTSRTISLLQSQGPQSINGYLGGVYGVLSRDGSDNYTFTRASAGSVVKVGVKMPFVPDISGHDFDTFMIFVGRNNLSNVSDIERDIAALVALQKTAEKRFLILTPTNGGPLTAGQVTTEGTGSGTLTNIKAVEDWAVQTYGDRVIKVREFSFQFNNGSSDDLNDVANETVPRSLRIDTVHYTTAFHAQLAAYVASEITRRGW